jgi:hypothetical protein
MESGQNGMTSISQLPPSGQVLGNDQIPQNTNQNQNQNMNNIVLTKNEIIDEPTSQMQLQNPGMQQAPQTSLPQNNNNNINNGNNNNNYNELISQLQQASAAGATGLPTRDIPINPNMVSNDVETKPNFIPPPPSNEDYINNMQTPDNLIMQNNNKHTHLESLDAFYNEFQLPILIAILYFLFQLPVFRRGVKKLLPSLFGSDGNPNLYGYLFNSALFSILFYVLIKVINQITTSISS